MTQIISDDLYPFGIEKEIEKVHKGCRCLDQDVLEEVVYLNWNFLSESRVDNIKIFNSLSLSLRKATSLQLIGLIAS